MGVGCAVIDVPGTKGSVLCWGAVGPWLSPPLPNDQPVRPTVIPGLTDVVDLAAAISTCARTRSGAVWCWGREPGTFRRDYEIVAAHPVAGIEDARCLSVYDSNACVAESSGKVLCWGDNFQGQVGDGTRTARRQPVPVDVPFAALGVSLSHTDVCAWSSEGKIACWGFDHSHQRTARRPAVVGDLPGLVKLVVREEGSCALRQDGTVVCWGFPASEPRLATIDNKPAWAVAGVTDAVDLAANDGFACALGRSGRLRCWGGSEPVPRPTRAPFPRHQPRDLDLPQDVAAVAAGNGALCVRRCDGRISCWGKNNDGQLGDGGALPRIEPVSVPLPGEPLPPAPALPVAAAPCRANPDCGWIVSGQAVRCGAAADATPAATPADGACSCVENFCTWRPGRSMTATPVACFADEDCLVDRGTGTCDARWPQDPRSHSQDVFSSGPTCTCREDSCHWDWVNPVRCTRNADCWFEGRRAIRRPARLRHHRFSPCVDGEQAPVCERGVCTSASVKASSTTSVSSPSSASLKAMTASLVASFISPSIGPA